MLGLIKPFPLIFFSYRASSFTSKFFWVSYYSISIPIWPTSSGKTHVLGLSLLPPRRKFDSNGGIIIIQSKYYINTFSLLFKNIQISQNPQFISVDHPFLFVPMGAISNIKNRVLQEPK